MGFKASIIVPACNAEESLYGCLNSLEHQNFEREEYEVIVVDDGSTDGTSNIARRFNVRVISQKRSGPANARNRGAKESSGDILLFIDSDCEADRDWVKAMLNSLSDPGIAGVQGIYRTNQKALTPRFAQLEIEERYKLMRKRRYIDFIGTYAAGYRRNGFLAMDMFDTSFPIASGEDIDLSFRMARKGYKMVLNSDAVVYHKHPDTLKKYLKQKYWRGYWRNLLYKKNAIKVFKDSYTPQLLKLQVLLVGLMSLNIFLIPFFGKAIWYIFPVELIIFLISVIPFVRFALTKDISVGLLSPLYILLRSISLFSGVLVGFIKEIVLGSLKQNRFRMKVFRTL